MNHSNEHLDKYIMRYLSNQLSDEELNQFETQIDNDPDLAYKIELLKLVYERDADNAISYENDLIVNSKQGNTLDRQINQSIQNNAGLQQRANLYDSLQNSLDTLYPSDSKPEKQARVVSFYSRHKKTILSAAAILIIAFLVGIYYSNVSNRSQNNTNTIANSYKQKTDNTNDYLAEETNQINKVGKTDETTQNKKSQVANNNKKSIKDVIETYLHEKVLDENATLLAVAEDMNYQLPDNYHENTFLSLRADAILRSPNIYIIKPYKYEILTNPVRLEWKIIHGETKIIILNNEKKVVWKKTMNNTNGITCPKELTPGTYYWIMKVKTEKEKSQTIRQFFVIHE